jgi:hypothetical protein
MSNVSVHAAAARLNDAVKVFRTAIAAAEPQWTDATRREFQETYLAPMAPQVKNMQAVIERLAGVFAAAERQCGSGEGGGDE